MSSAAPAGPAAALEPYVALLEHAELELELAGRGEVEAILALRSRWEELVGSVPESPPQAAATLLQRATLIHERTHIELIRLREALVADLATSRQASRAAHGYAGQLTPRPRLDRSA